MAKNSAPAGPTGYGRARMGSVSLKSEDGATAPTSMTSAPMASAPAGHTRTGRTWSDNRPGDPDGLATGLIRRFEQLKSRRSTWETHWQDIADHVLPQREFLTAAPHNLRGEKRTRRLFDSTAPMANELLASALAGMLTNASLTWFSLRADDPDLEDRKGVRPWLEAARDRMMRAFADPDANFYPQIHEVYKDLAGFGTAAFYVGDEDGCIRFQARALAELFIAEDARGRIDTLFRRYWLSARQAEQRWDRRIGDAARRALDTDPDREIAYLHAVLPAEDLPRDGVRRRGGMPWASVHVELESRTLIAVGGFHEFPFMIPRWSKMVGEVYGRSPAMLALADIRMVNAMSETVLKAAQKAVDPPLQVPHDGFMTPLNLTPGAVNFYDPSAGGRGGGIEPIATAGRIDLGLEMMDQRRKNIRAAHLVDQLLSDSGPQQTATEVLQRTEERMRILGPTIGRLQSELLGPAIRRTFAILERQDALPPRPPALRARPIEVDYVAPIVRRQKLSEVSGLSQMVDVVQFAAQIDPAAAQVIDAPAAVRYMAEALALPPALIRAAPAGPEESPLDPGGPDGTAASPASVSTPAPAAGGAVPSDLPPSVLAAVQDGLASAPGQAPPPVLAAAQDSLASGLGQTPPGIPLVGP